MRRSFLTLSGLALMASTAALASDASHHWSYVGEGGPSHWAELDSAFANCARGKAQSPIDIRTTELHGQSLPALEFDYRPSRLHITDNGHSIQIDVDPGSSLRIGDDTYQLVQFHFHHPSEERINGQSSDMDAHLVHRDSQGRLAVVAVQLKVGQPNSTVDALWNHLPKEKEHRIDFNDVTVNAAALLPAGHGYFTYTGSLTTPPCSEGVRWIVMKSPSTLSKAEIATFASHYPNDARPVQQLNGRQVLVTN